MTIKRQFITLIVAIIIVPLSCTVFIPVYHYMSSPERVLLEEYEQMRKMDEISLSDADWKELYGILHRAPPDVQTALIANHTTVLLSSIPELKPHTELSDGKLFSLIKTTNTKYYYQFTSPPVSKEAGELMLLNRIPRNAKHEKHTGGLMKYTIIFLGVFIIVCLLFIAYIAHTIFSSITILEQKTQKIADGDLSVPLGVKTEKRQSNEITSLTESLDKMRHSLLESQERRTRFIMGISHDLRTPVAVIKGYTEAISDNVVTDPEEIKKSLEIIGTKTNQLENEIDTLINFVKLDSKDWRQKLVPENIAAVVEEFAKNAEMTGTVFKRNVTSDIHISAEIRVPMDKQLFQRALENLYSNAIRYSKENDSITITGEEKNEYVYVTVSDTGCGIAQKDLEHIFDLFYRGTNSRREEGMGIGLSVVKNIIDTHGWTISVQSEVGKGSSFIITIPKNTAN